MIKRILIVVMLIFMLFDKYAKVPAQGFSKNQPVLSSATLVKTAAGITPTPEALPYTGSTELGTAPLPETTPMPDNTPLPETTPIPEITPAPEAAPLPDVTPLPEVTPIAESVPTPPGIDLGPLVDKLPAFDTQSPEAKAFKADMEAIISKAAKQSGIKTIYGVFIMDLKTELYYGVNENLTRIDYDDNVPEGYFNSASVIKLFQGYLFCDIIRRGELDGDKTYYDKVTGRKFKLLPMLKSMISRSDNNYCNACLRIVDNKRSNEVLNRLGIKNSRIYGEISPAIGYSKKNNIAKYGTAKSCARITPFDTCLILYNVYKNKSTDPYMKALNEALLGNIYNSRIPTGVKRVSKKYPVAHKTGTSSSMGVYNDAGIVYTENPFILVAFTKGTTSNIGHTFIRSLAEQLTRYFDK